MHTYVCAYTYIHTYDTLVHTSIHPSIHPSIYPSIHPSIHTYIRTYVHTYIHNTQVDPEYISAHDINPLLEIQLRLTPPDIIFLPELGRTAARTGLEDIVLGWSMSFCNIGLLVKRIDTAVGDGDYLADIQVCFVCFVYVCVCVNVCWYV